MTVEGIGDSGGQGGLGGGFETKYSALKEGG